MAVNACVIDACLQSDPEALLSEDSSATYHVKEDVNPANLSAAELVGIIEGRVVFAFLQLLQFGSAAKLQFANRPAKLTNAIHLAHTHAIPPVCLPARNVML